MNIKPYDKGNAGIHNFSGVVLNMTWYVEVFGVGQFVFPPVVPMYDKTIPDNATKTVVKRREMTREGQQSDHTLYGAYDKDSLKFITEVVNSTWFATLEHPDTLLRMWRRSNSSNIWRTSAWVSMGSMRWNTQRPWKPSGRRLRGYRNTSSGWRCYRKIRQVLSPNHNWLYKAVEYKSLLVSGDYLDDMCKWKKNTAAKQTWEAWKVKFMAAYSYMKVLKMV